MLAAAKDGLLFATVQVYCPRVVTVRVCMYVAFSESSNTVSVPSVIVVESLVQVTVVAGPPVEIQVRVSWSESNVTSSLAIMILPKSVKNNCLCSSTKGTVFYIKSGPSGVLISTLLMSLPCIEGL